MSSDKPLIEEWCVLEKRVWVASRIVFVHLSFGGAGYGSESHLVPDSNPVLKTLENSKPPIMLTVPSSHLVSLQWKTENYKFW